MPKSLKRIGRTHLIIPDGQVKQGVNIDHWLHIGHYIAEKRPDVIINLGDMADIPSFSKHNSALDQEGLRYADDLEAVKRALHLLMKPWKGIKSYKPKMVLTLGNHEDRVRRHLEEHPSLIGAIEPVEGVFKASGWAVAPFLQPVTIDDVEYCHYFVSGAMGRPVSSAKALLHARHKSAIMGHVQLQDVAFHPRSGHFAIFAGICYTHDEKYLNPQGNVLKRQVWMLHEVRNGQADHMQVSLEFLRRKYS